MKTLILKCALAMAAGCIFSHTGLAAAQYSIDWFKVAAGGGTSGNAQFAVSGTPGQPDAGAMTGGSYSVSGGFWALFALQQTGLPLLRLFPTSTNTVVLSWPAPSTGFILQQSSAISSGSWSNITTTPLVVGNQNEVVVGPPNGIRFYRLKK